MASQDNNSQERIRSGEPRVCAICGDVLESSRALRNHRRYCTSEQDDVEMTDGDDFEMDVDINVSINNSTGTEDGKI